MSEPVVAIVGRPNVGKSTLLNRILGRQEAIVEEEAGVTRDRKEVLAEWSGCRFRLVDTGGWLARGDELTQMVSRQAERALEEADLVLLVVDATVGVTEQDAEVAELLRGRGVPVLVVVNKVDDAGREPLIWDFLGLGLGDPWPISALHGRGTGDLLDEIVGRLPERLPPGSERAEPRSADVGETEPGVARIGSEGGALPRGEVVGVLPPRDQVFSIAIVGRPNAGKSTLFNRLIGVDRSVVHDVAGTTRDTVDTLVETVEGPIRFVDTAGMRRRGKVEPGTEYYSVVRTLRAVDESDVALLVVDATVGVTHQDQRLAERIDAAGCPVVLVLNKWDALDDEGRDRVIEQMVRRLHFLGDSPVLRVSAKTGRGVQRILPALGGTLEEYERRIPTAEVNRVLRAAQTAQPAPAGGRVLYATQGASHPPTFTLFTNKELPRTYVRYLERRLREAFGLGSTPVKLRVRPRTR